VLYVIHRLMNQSCYLRHQNQQRVFSSVFLLLHSFPGGITSHYINTSGSFYKYPFVSVQKVLIKGQEKAVFLSLSLYDSLLHSLVYLWWRIFRSIYFFLFNKDYNT
jgi:hypothetical protein